MNAATKTQIDDQLILIRKQELRMMLGGASDMSIWRWVRSGKLPPPRRIPGMHPRWVLAEVKEALSITSA